MFSAVGGAVGLLILRWFLGLGVGPLVDFNADYLPWAGLPWWTLPPESSSVTVCGLVLWAMLGLGVYHHRHR